MKELVQKIFRCEYCGKVYLRKHACVAHENVCKKNPINMAACFNCELLEWSKLQDETEYNDYDQSEFDVKKLVPWYCPKLKTYMVTRPMLVKYEKLRPLGTGIAWFITEYDESRDECINVKAMPSKCDKQKSGLPAHYMQGLNF